MNYTCFLKCEEFSKAYEEFLYDEILGMSAFDADDFFHVSEDLDESLIDFFNTFDLRIVRESNYPVSYSVISKEESTEYFNIKTMFIELIELLYGCTTDY